MRHAVVASDRDAVGHGGENPLGTMAFVSSGRRFRQVDTVHALIAVGVNGDGQREVLGLEVASAEDGAGWLGFLRGLTARGLSGVKLVISDAHRGLVDAIAAALPGAGWQRCRTHYLRNLLTKVSAAATSWCQTCGGSPLIARPVSSAVPAAKP